jgi:hypothetical protein
LASCPNRVPFIECFWFNGFDATDFSAQTFDNIALNILLDGLLLVRTKNLDFKTVKRFL